MAANVIKDRARRRREVYADPRYQPGYRSVRGGIVHAPRGKKLTLKQMVKQMIEEGTMWDHKEVITGVL